ncbi:MAG: sensor histidine kinase [Rhodobacteraceae bacterium]|nr:sensor histidine kinase [Paracoccaceae bacterium]
MPNSKIRFRRRLGVRLMLFLSLALIPVGLLAVLQTQEVVNRINVQSERQLADRTRSAARAMREGLLWAVGAANGLGPFVLAVGDDNPECAKRLTEFVHSRDGVVAAGAIRPDGQMRCASNGAVADLADNADMQDLMAHPRTVVNYSPSGLVSHQPVIAATVPYYDSERLAGFVFVSQAHDGLQSDGDGINGATFKTFNTDGDILSSSDEDSSATALLPQGVALSELASNREITFTGVSRGGDTRIYSVIPIINGTVYAMGIWSPQSSGNRAFGLAASVPLFPILMWLTSLIVAYAAVDRLALRHIRRLRVDMRRFAANRSLPHEATPDMAAEIYDINDAFRVMTETVIRDEADLERLVHDKNVLLKEVHHRVKNNLQLISSMMNMQMRKVHAPEAKNALKRLQSRVLSLATIHRTLYNTENLGSVDAGPLLEQVVNNLAALASADTRVRIETEFDSIRLYPDQAVPVSLLTTEAVTNALKHTGISQGESGWVRISLIEEDHGWARLTAANSKGPVPLMDAESRTGSGLGTSLIRAFAGQLDAVIEIDDTPESYRLSCRFKVLGFVDGEAEDDRPPLVPEDADAPM